MAVLDDDRVLALLPGDESRTHGERLPSEIARALDLAKVTRPQIDLLAVATGPGAFTGLRIGLAAMQGLAMALRKPVAGVSAIDALAAQVDDDVDLIVPWMDAQRGDVFAAIFTASRGVDAWHPRAAPIEAPATGAPASLVDAWHQHLDQRRVVFIGDAVQRDAAVLTRDGWIARSPAPLAPQIARLGRQAAARGDAGPPHALTPIYVRRPDAEIERERRRS